MPEDTQDALLLFRGAFGYYCTLAASLVRGGATRDVILKARTVRSTTPYFATLYDAWRRMCAHAEALKARGVSNADLSEYMRQAKHAVEQEFECKVPVTSER